MPPTRTVTNSKAAGLDATGRLVRSPPGFTCVYGDDGFGAVWIRLTGELDLATASQLAQTLQEAQVDAQLVVLDLRELAFMDCAGLRVIAAAAERARRDGPRLLVIRGPPQVDRVFALTRPLGHPDVIEIYDHYPRELPSDRTLPLAAGA